MSDEELVVALSLANYRRDNRRHWDHADRQHVATEQSVNQRAFAAFCLTGNQDA